ncbi:cytochrome P450 4C1-like isoform X1 [Aricia agestis]|uniref:cytochrome P450 4C1-like isoform X1 n=1 Tax=Aricia agestis TaxID=91739 RepID=UPI001C209415|nr:cytochrome P450 4C1-like isoform X1 [Aricia agestis]
MFFYLFGFAAFLVVIHILFNYNPKARAILRIPTTSGNFIIGHALNMLLCSEVELFRLGREMAAKFQGIYGFHAFPVSIVNIYNPEDVEIITSNMKHHEKGFIYKFLQPWLQEGLLLSNGPKWQKRRKILTSAFHFNIIPKYFATMKDNDKVLIETLKKSDGQPIDIVTTISEYTLNTICETAMGTKLSEKESELGKSYKEAIYALGRLLVKRYSNVFAYSDFIYFYLTSLGRRQVKYLNVIQDFTKTIIKQRKEALNANEVSDINDNNEEDEMTGRKKRTVMLDLLLSVQKNGQIDDKGIQEEVDTFMFEGHDTTAGGLTYTLLLLANHSDIQKKVVEELYKIFGEDTREATLGDLAEMKYLELCLKESVRLYPPVPHILRQITQPCKLSNFDIPANTMCSIHIYDLHHNPKLYPDPEKFDPERFLPENSVGRHNYAYIPFSAGPRNCIGQKFAMMEMKSAISSILRNFELVPVTKVEEVVLTADIVLRNTDPIYVKFQPKSRYLNLINI